MANPMLEVNVLEAVKLLSSVFWKPSITEPGLNVKRKS